MKHKTDVTHHCCMCNKVIDDEDSVIFIIHSKRDHHAHENCVDPASIEFAECIGITLEYGYGWEIEDYEDD